MAGALHPLSLSAQRSRIVRQLLTESLLLSGFGGLLALQSSYVGAHALLALAFPSQNGMPVNPRLASGHRLCYCAFPAYRSSLRTGPGIDGRARAACGCPALERPHRRPRRVVHSARACDSAGRSLSRSPRGCGPLVPEPQQGRERRHELDATNRYIVHINPQAAGYQNTKVEPLYQAIEDRFHAIPGVPRVALATYTPMEADHTCINHKDSRRAQHP